MRDETYTHIVVGAGSAGCVVAARVAENRNFRVLLIEAGSDCDPETCSPLAGVRDSRRVPMKGQSELFDPALDWNIDVSIPGGQSMQIPQAKVVGGGSSINGGTALRNTVADSEEWVRMGNDRWNFRSVYEVYQSLEDDSYRGTRGPHPIARASRDETGRIQRAFLDGALACGMPSVHDLNATGAEGAGPSPVCRRGQVRISAANTFIDPIRIQSNLTIMSNAQVDKVLFSGTKARGVLLTDERILHVSQEVVVCAGAIFSPAILQRSGVGPAPLLQDLQIDVLSDLPVGCNLSDHPCIPVVSRPKPGAYAQGDSSLEMQARWSSTRHPGAIDLQMVCFSYLFVPAAETQTGRSLAGTATGHVAGIGCNVNKPTSLGNVTIRSTDAIEYPVVNPAYLNTSHDREIAREVVRQAYRVITCPAMQDVLEEPLTLRESIVEDDAALDEWISSQLSSTYHFCGTCRMASRRESGVVDQSGRVYGVDGLRVADASVIPTVPASNTMWTTMMFAERIGCSIRDAIDVGTALRASL
ncbi:5-(hydroxymethyl)furfural oxidase [Cyphellophora attinorum]|uniref:5-(Hydroxymethyl)furfural oxidase n=1 Tax=Cyphellophora attinorum TaxID=1664694 RepID=A0A0N1GYV7_9EURO|nr:5-(hydroxymethyl)furfural oxidase [Phialophora attinorum]KPI35997.1 5-(hydroxymethyl)furfural oxidase [Phialophora attinorum]